MVPKSTKKERTKLLHKQLTTDFRERILDGRLPAGTRLLNDNVLAAQYQLSRDTVRQALAHLADEGLIERIQGRGTFVCQPPPKGQDVSVVPEQKQIGLLLSIGDRSGSSYPQDILVGVEHAIKSHGYSISLSYTEGDQEQQAREIARMSGNHVAGLIICPVTRNVNADVIRQIQAVHVPLIFVDRYLSGLSIDYVGADNRGGGYRATEHLIILGHRRIGFIFLEKETMETTSSVKERWQGYFDALQKYGVPYDPSLIMADANLKYASASSGIQEFLQRTDRPSAVFAVNDFVALDVMQAAHALHLRIPQDLALVGFDNEHFASRINPPLTTVNQPFFDIGLRAGTLLVNRIESNISAPRHIELPVNLLIRESCGAQLHVQQNTGKSVGHLRG